MIVYIYIYIYIYRTLVTEGSYPSAEMQSMYSTAPAERATGHSSGKGLIPLLIFSRCLLQPQPNGPQDIRPGGVLPFCRDAVDVFYSPSWMSHRTFVQERSYPFAEIQSMYSIVPTEWATGHTLGRSLTPLPRFSRYILQSQPNIMIMNRCVRVFHSILFINILR